MTRPGSGTFVGRQRELDGLVSAVSGGSGESSTWLLGGDAGVGKTRLIEELTTRTDGATVAVVVGGCIHTAHGSLPFVAITEALRRLCSRYDSAEVTAATTGLTAIGLLLPELVPDRGPEVGATDESQVRLFDAVLTMITRLAESRRVCMVLEDLHWADTSTRDLFVFLARNLVATRATLIGTYRSDEMSRTHPLRPVLAELDRSPRVTHITLEPFTAAELTTYAAAILSEAPPASILDEVGVRSGGNAFYALEILDAITAGRHTVRPELADLILSRVEGLSLPTQELLRLLSAAGESARDELLQAVVEMDRADLVASLREALDHQAITLTDDGPLRFRHALMQEAVYSTLLPTERQRAHARYAHALLEAPHLSSTPQSCDAELAWHFREAREFDRALSASVAAARTSEAQLAFAEALGHIEAVIEIWTDVEDAEKVAGMRKAEALTWAASLADASGNYLRAVQFQRAAVDEVGAAPPPELALMRVRLGRHLQSSGLPTAALEQYDQAMELVPPDPPSRERALVLAGYGQELMLLLDVDRSVEVLEEAIATARQVGDRGIEGHALNSLGSIMLHNGRADSGVEMLLEAQQIAREEANPSDILRTYVNLVGGLLEAGDLHTAERLGFEGTKIAAELGHERGYGFFISSNLADVLTEMAKFDEAEDFVEHLKRPDGNLPKIWLIHSSIDLPLRRGDLQEARRVLDSLAPHIVDVGDPQIMPTYWQRHADLALALGDLETCRAAIAKGLAVASVLTHVLNLRLTSITVDALVADEDPEALTRAEAQLAQMENLIENTMDPAETRSHRAMALLTQARAETTAARGENSAALWEAAAQQWGAGGFAWHRARALRRLGEALLQVGEREQAATALAESESVAASIGAVALEQESRTLIAQAGLADGSNAAGSTGELTGRELDVLRLLVEGRTNRQIGEELFISPKTASVHVSRILQKLQVENRTEAASAARRAGLV